MRYQIKTFFCTPVIPCSHIYNVHSSSFKINTVIIQHVSTYFFSSNIQDLKLKIWLQHCLSLLPYIREICPCCAEPASFNMVVGKCSSVLMSHGDQSQYHINDSQINGKMQGGCRRNIVMEMHSVALCCIVLSEFLNGGFIISPSLVGAGIRGED